MFNHINLFKNKIAVLILLFVSAFGFALPAQASWSLTNAERADFLEYYAPIIFKRGNGNGNDYGKDWITNFGLA